jgi:hypothetical protein
MMVVEVLKENLEPRGLVERRDHVVRVAQEDPEDIRDLAALGVLREKEDLAVPQDLVAERVRAGRVDPEDLKGKEVVQVKEDLKVLVEAAAPVAQEGPEVLRDEMDVQAREGQEVLAGAAAHVVLRVHVVHAAQEVREVVKEKGVLEDLVEAAVHVGQEDLEVLQVLKDVREKEVPADLVEAAVHVDLRAPVARADLEVQEVLMVVKGLEVLREKEVLVELQDLVAERDLADRAVPVDLVGHVALKGQKVRMAVMVHRVKKEKMVAMEHQDLEVLAAHVDLPEEMEKTENAGRPVRMDVQASMATA